MACLFIFDSGLTATTTSIYSPSSGCHVLTGKKNLFDRNFF
ncbi:MAG: hypothetical protein OP8BY_1301 [Candidatus Saccharicenans subterraneus]|uniref:Uncharacterized protein n=1 Tax=Candidatus Saccharicenans subterraneus TaxID=2508984 RepID=A0A3E2BPP3_9BACT|nr:MAG: hypothetical protein OP8BY_1301 [Candidatus Saccharicenans subterraneum]